jgi:hypothetical protein
VWDGCYERDIEKLEKIQLEAARIVTGLTKYASKDSLYFETGWETLANRRETRNESGRFGALKSDSTHHFFRNVCTKSGSLRFSQFSGC